MMLKRIFILFLVILLDGCTVFCGGGAASAAADTDDVKQPYVFAGLVTGAFEDINFQHLQGTLRAWKKREILIPCDKLNDLLTIAAQNGTVVGPVEKEVHTYQRTAYINKLNSCMEKGKFAKALKLLAAKKDHEFSDMAMKILPSERDRWATTVMTRDKEFESQLQKLRFLKFGRTLSNILKLGSVLSFYEVIHRIYIQDSSLLYLLLGLGALSTSFVVPLINPYEYIEQRRRDGQLLLAKVAQLDHIASVASQKQHDSELSRSAGTVVGSVVEQREKKDKLDGGAVAKDGSASAAGVGLPHVKKAGPGAQAREATNPQAGSGVRGYLYYFLPSFGRP